MPHRVRRIFKYVLIDGIDLTAARFYRKPIFLARAANNDSPNDPLFASPGQSTKARRSYLRW